MPLKQIYSNLVQLTTKNAVGATLVMILALTAVSTSAAQLLAPEDYKPTTVLGLNKVQTEFQTKLNNITFDYNKDTGILKYQGLTTSSNSCTSIVETNILKEDSKVILEIKLQQKAEGGLENSSENRSDQTVMESQEAKCQDTPTELEIKGQETVFLDSKQLNNFNNLFEIRVNNQSEEKQEEKEQDQEAKTLTLPEYPDFSMEYPQGWEVEIKTDKSYPEIDQKTILLKKENSEFKIPIWPLIEAGCGDPTEFTRNSFSSQDYIYLNTTNPEYDKEIVAEGKVNYIFGRKDNQNFDRDCFLSNDTIYSNISSDLFKQTFKKDKVESLIGFTLTFDPKDRQILDEVGQMLDSVEGIVDQEEQEEQNESSLQDQDIIQQLEKELGIQIPKVSKERWNAPGILIGYTTNPQQKVIRLSIPGYSYKKKIKNEHLQLITKLTSLEWLWLSDTQITKIEGLEKLTNLQNLSLASDQITKIEGLEKLTNLQDLGLEGQISKIEGLDSLTNLKYLGLGGQISKIEGLDNLINLRELSLSYNQISKIEGLDSLINLQELDLSNNKITQIEGFDKLTSLQVLYLLQNQISKIEGLDNLINLQYLNLDYNQISKTEGLDSLTSLQDLRLSENQITDARPLKGLLLNQKNAGKKVLNISRSMHENPLQTPPVEVIDSGSEAFLEWVEENDK